MAKPGRTTDRQLAAAAGGGDERGAHRAGGIRSEAHRDAACAGEERAATRVAIGGGADGEAEHLVARVDRGASAIDASVIASPPPEHAAANSPNNLQLMERLYQAILRAIETIPV